MLAKAVGGGGGGRWTGWDTREVGPVRSGKPAVERLSTQELPRLLPWSGSASRFVKEVGTWEACTFRAAVSFVACTLVYGSSVELASVAALYWAWGPICGTVLPNFLLRVRYRYAGIWRARVMRAQIVPAEKYAHDSRGRPAGFFNRLPKNPPTLELEIGDGSAATFQMQVPLMDDMPEVKAGESVAVMVVSDKPSLSRFKALHDVYVPGRRLWISEDTCVQREPFQRLQRTWNRSLERQTGQGRRDGRMTKLLPEEAAWSRDGVNMERVLRRKSRRGTSELDYAFDMDDERSETRSFHEVDGADADPYL